MRKLRVLSSKLAVAALALLLSASASAAMLARQSGAFGIVTYDQAPVPTAPVISPASGTAFESSLTVTISCETQGAAIYYTTDGSEPTKDSMAYKRFKIYGKTTVKAVAYDAASDVYSEVATAEYALGTCANPVIAPSGGSAVATEGGYVFYRDGQAVTIARNGDEGTIRYTLDGTDPTASLSENGNRSQRRKSRWRPPLPDPGRCARSPARPTAREYSIR
jgi:hypothetical protein